MTYDALSATLDELEAELEDALAGDPMRGNVALFGSVVLERHGLRDRVGDVDLFVSVGLFTRLERRPGWMLEHGEHPGHPVYLVRSEAELEVHAFYAWRGDEPEVDAQEALDAALDVGPLLYAPLALVRKHKAGALRYVTDRQGIVDYVGTRWEKHLRDLERIDALLEA